MHEKWTIYCHTLKTDGRRYIGLTSHTMEKRWKEHIKNSKSGRSYFQNAIRKYGYDAFEHKVLAQSWDLEGANETERTIIEQEDTRNSENGFNLALGGQHALNSNQLEYRAKLSEIAKATQSVKYLHTLQARAASKASLNTPESKSRRSAVMKAIANTPEYRTKLSKIFKKIANTSESKKKKSTVSKSIQSVKYFRTSQACINRKIALNTPESKAKRSAAIRAALNTPESKARRSAAAKLSMNTPESKAKRSLVSKRIASIPEYRTKLSIIAKKQWQDPEYRMAVSNASKNHTRSKDTV